MRPGTLTPLGISRLAALGAIAISLGVLALYAFLCWVSLSRNVTGGMDDVNQNVAFLSMLVPALVIVAIHLAFAKYLWGFANGKRYTY